MTNHKFHNQAAKSHACLMLSPSIQTGMQINLQLQLYDFNYSIFNAISEH